MSVIIGVSVGALFKESEQLRSHAVASWSQRRNRSAPCAVACQVTDPRGGVCIVHGRRDTSVSGLSEARGQCSLSPTRSSNGALGLAERITFGDVLAAVDLALTSAERELDLGAAAYEVESQRDDCQMVAIGSR